MNKFITNKMPEIPFPSLIKITEIKNIKDEVKKASDEIELNWEVVKKSGEKELTDTETVIKIKKEGSERNITLEKAKESFEKLKAQVLLTKTEEKSLGVIDDAIKNPDKYKDIPIPSDLTAKDLKDIFKLTDITVNIKAHKIVGIFWLWKK